MAKEKFAMFGCLARKSSYGDFAVFRQTELVVLGQARSRLELENIRPNRAEPETELNL